MWVNGIGDPFFSSVQEHGLMSYIASSLLLMLFLVAALLVLLRSEQRSEEEEETSRSKAIVEWMASPKGTVIGKGSEPGGYVLTIESEPFVTSKNAIKARTEVEVQRREWDSYEVGDIWDASGKAR